MKTNLLVLSLFISLLSSAQVAAFQWARHMGDTLYDYATGVAADASGNVYSCGIFMGNADFDPGPGTAILAGGVISGFASKLDSAGNYLWAKNVAATTNFGGSYAIGLALDASANVYVAGYFSATVDFDPGPGTMTATVPGNFNNTNGFISKLDAMGNLLWVKTYGGSSQTQADKMHRDAAGNIYITGYFVGTADFDPGVGVFNLVSPSASTPNTYILKLDPNGNFLWAGQMQNSGTNCTLLGIVTDIAGNIYTTGFFDSTVDFDPGPGTSQMSPIGVWDIFITKIDASGNLVWAKQFGGAGAYNTGNSLAIDQSGDIIAVGYFGNTTDFDPNAGIFNLTIGNWGSAYAMKMSPAGNLIWARATANSTVPRALVLSSAGDIYTSGYFNGVTDFDPGPGVYNLTSPMGTFYAYTCRLDAAANFVWVKSVQGATATAGVPSAIALDSWTGVYTAGAFDKTQNFNPPGSYSMTSYGQTDIFIQKIIQCNIPAAPANVTPLANQHICAGNTATLSVSSPSTSVNWYATSTGTQALGALTNFTTPPLTTGNYTFYAGARTCTNSTARTAITITVSTCLGLDELEDDLFISVYPNPTSDVVTFKNGTQCQYFTVRVYDALGRLVVERNVITEAVIDLSAVPQGIYTLKFFDGSTVLGIKKLVRE
jgi:hypothetical protein